MDLVLDPPRGVKPVLLGMTLDEAVAAVSPWGAPEVLTRRTRRSVKVSASCDGVGFQALLEDGEQVTAIELWWPGEGKETSTRVLLNGDDVFRTPAEDILRRAAERGWRVDDSQPENPVIPRVSLGFTRQTSQEVPRGSDGLPVCFTSVLVGGEDYYDYRYENRG
ncbi:hypothetical protein [Streptomyces sp. GC420]|uniref:hypothetical protein n=1 Tax=Streptomyces sp. GC420 TaxID=2697568 RepID=UPI001414F43B|nr:hypothetical protein [Streptomyces sp. GC420]NBM16757.1 hypothetical protein [Streptomyces sp. GC420]